MCIVFLFHCLHLSHSVSLKENGSLLPIYDYHLSADAKYLLVKTDYKKVCRFLILCMFTLSCVRKKQWRYSNFGNYYIHNIETQATYPLAPPTNPPTISHAVWSPTGDAIAYVQSNDLYIRPSLEYVFDRLSCVSDS